MAKILDVPTKSNLDFRIRPYGFTSYYDTFNATPPNGSRPMWGPVLQGGRRYDLGLSPCQTGFQRTIFLMVASGSCTGRRAPVAHP